MRILVIDDNKLVFSILESGLKKLDYTLDYARNRKEAFKLLDTYKNSYSAILVDVNLPDGSGIQLCKDIRKVDKHTVIIFVSQYKDVQTKIEALESGADDYVIKPFSILEVDARIKAVNRRSPEIKRNYIKFGKYSLDLSERVLKEEVENKTIHLTPIEYRILVLLAEKIDLPLSREEIINRAWNKNGDQVFSNSIDVHIRSLRKKTEDNYIETVRGYGYKLKSK